MGLQKMESYVIAPDTHSAIDSYGHNVKDIPIIYISVFYSVCVIGLIEFIVMRYLTFQLCQNLHRNIIVPQNVACIEFIVN